MAALTAPRLATVEKEGYHFARDMAAGVRIFAGSLVALNAAGTATPGTAAVGLVADGIAIQTVDNIAGAAGAAKVLVSKGCWRLANSAAADAITRADIGEDCWIVDDQTVAKTDGGATRSIAGTIVDVDAQGVWVRFV